MFRTWFEVHVPIWQNDSHAGTYKTLAEARERAAQLMTDGHTERGETKIFKEQEISLPFGWHLTRTRLLTKWS